MAQTERDTVEVVAFLKKEDMKKDEQVGKSRGLILMWIMLHSCKHAGLRTKML